MNISEALVVIAVIIIAIVISVLVNDFLQAIIGGWSVIAALVLLLFELALIAKWQGWEI